MMSVSGRLVLIAGATSASGRAVGRQLVDAGARVVAVGSRPEALARYREEIPGSVTLVCDLGDPAAVASLAERIHAEHGRIDGLIHLVGGWRGGGGLAGQTDEDWDFLHARVLTTLRNTTRVFIDDLHASDAGRLAIVSTTTLDKPMPGGANYAAAKAAAETWVKAIANGFAKSAPAASATIFVVRSLDGLEPQLATAVTALWDSNAASGPLHRVPLADAAG
ncbi:short chain dehydrogenase [Mycetocola miduiensis]|uniref:Short chain dehydrogenase n=2 Tax=Mycetocola miduiensis TaxID=995034 RepID=A0A1I5AZX3_9MICO|nr:short chain dehydrogenase [Mycetocola miduiensis]